MCVWGGGDVCGYESRVLLVSWGHIFTGTKAKVYCISYIDNPYTVTNVSAKGVGGGLFHG